MDPKLLPGGVPIRSCPSPNHGARRGDARPSLIVLHYTAMETAEAALTRLCDPAAEVSAHYLIAEDGRVWQLVDEARRAWHAGAGCWRDIRDVNSASIGIELANAARDDRLTPFPDVQMQRLEDLLADIIARWRIPARGVIAHSDAAVARKRDPGPKFDWRRLARRGLSVWPAAQAPGAGGARGSARADPESASALLPRFQRGARAVGYPPPDVVAADDILAAFRLRFRPWASGPLCAADVEIIECLAREAAGG